MAHVVILPNILADHRDKMRAPHHHDNTSRVRRALFGRASDPRENCEFARRELRQIEETQMRRWNFNFATGEPVVGGRFPWTAVDASEGVHPSYALCRMPFCGKGACEQTTDCPPSEQPSTSSTATEDQTTKNATKQTTILDFMKTRKRSLTMVGSSKSAESSPKIAAKVRKTLSS